MCIRDSSLPSLPALNLHVAGTVSLSAPRSPAASLSSPPLSTSFVSAYCVQREREREDTEERVVWAGLECPKAAAGPIPPLTPLLSSSPYSPPLLLPNSATRRVRSLCAVVCSWEWSAAEARAVCPDEPLSHVRSHTQSRALTMWGIWFDCGICLGACFTCIWTQETTVSWR
eukprot:237102-Rhodomonas_salina.1